MITVSASAPGRVDVGGRVDLPSYFCRYPSGSLRTASIAISLRTQVGYVSVPGNMIILRSGDLEEHGLPYRDPEDSTNQYFWAAMHHFRAPCGLYTITSDIPQSAGLGGSSAMIVSLLAVVSMLSGARLSTRQQLKQLLHTSYLFENALGRTSAGFQDYHAAIFGDARHWAWGAGYQSATTVGRGTTIAAHYRQPSNLSMLVGYTGEPHGSNRIHEPRPRIFSQSEYDGWLQVAQHATTFASALKCTNWRLVANTMKVERNLWLKLSGESVSARTKTLINAAEGTNVGVRFAGVPTGGSVWAVGPSNEVRSLQEIWCKHAEEWPGARILPVKVAAGLELVHNDDSEQKR